MMNNNFKIGDIVYIKKKYIDKDLIHIVSRINEESIKKISINECNKFIIISEKEYEKRNTSYSYRFGFPGFYLRSINNIKNNRPIWIKFEDEFLSHNASNMRNINFKFLTDK